MNDTAQDTGGASGAQEPSAIPNTNPREWLKVGPNPERYEYGRTGAVHGRPADALAYVEREPSGGFRWGVYRGEHDPKAAPSLQEAQERAIATLKERGVDV